MVTIFLREKREYLWKEKPLQVNCVQLAPFSEALPREAQYKAVAVSKKKKRKTSLLPLYTENQILFKPQAKPEIYHAKMF